MDVIRWGILGTGSIAKQFARGLRAAPGAKLVAVGSRAAETAAGFGAEFDVPHRHASYADLVADPAVDVVYVATPHPFHKDCALLALGAGKPVLCEKPFAVNAVEARAMVSAARAAGLFLMEAMWTRCIPVVARVRDWVRSGCIGEVRQVCCDFGFRAGLNPEGRLFNARMGGGALLDVGVYAVSFASMIYGVPPARYTSAAHIGETGVDEQNAMVFLYPNGALALLSSAVRTTTPQGAWLQGTEGSIRIHAPFWKATSATLTVYGREETTVTMPHLGNGFEFEAMEVGACLRAGAKESVVMPLDESIAIMETLDGLRAQWGLRYPMEQAD